MQRAQRSHVDKTEWFPNDIWELFQVIFMSHDWHIHIHIRIREITNTCMGHFKKVSNSPVSCSSISQTKMELAREERARWEKRMNMFAWKYLYKFWSLYILWHLQIHRTLRRWRRTSGLCVGRWYWVEADRGNNLKSLCYPGAPHLHRKHALHHWHSLQSRSKILARHFHL